MKKMVLDTNAYARLLAGNNDVLAAVASTELIYMSIFVLGELYAGFAGGVKQRENKAILNLFLSKPSVKILNATSETAEIFGVLKADLKQSGTSLPINDVWIAAHAVETGAVIVTFDQHFRKISGIRLWDAAP
jgi:tRNA(fMet)-specific endonuclease VapC